MQTKAPRYTHPSLRPREPGERGDDNVTFGSNFMSLADDGIHVQAMGMQPGAEQTIVGTAKRTGSLSLRGHFGSADNEGECYEVRLNDGRVVPMYRRSGSNYVLCHDTSWVMGDARTGTPKPPAPPVHLGYEDLVNVVQKHADCKFTDTDGWVQYGRLVDHERMAPLPRHHLLRQTGRDVQIADIFVEGMESVIKREYYEGVLNGTNDWPAVDHYLHEGYAVELIGMFFDRGGFEHLGDGTDDAHETKFGQLEDRAEVLERIKGTYLLHALGLSTLEVALLADYPNRVKVYHLSLYEGEGWWGSFTFALKLPEPYVAPTDEERAALACIAEGKPQGVFNVPTMGEQAEQDLADSEGPC